MVAVVPLSWAMLVSACSSLVSEPVLLSRFEPCTPVVAVPPAKSTFSCIGTAAAYRMLNAPVAAWSARAGVRSAAVQITCVYTAVGIGPMPSGSTFSVSTVDGTTQSTIVGWLVPLIRPLPGCSSGPVLLSSAEQPRNSSPAGR